MIFTLLRPLLMPLSLLWIESHQAISHFLFPPPQRFCDACASKRAGGCKGAEELHARVARETSSVSGGAQPVEAEPGGCPSPPPSPIPHLFHFPPHPHPLPSPPPAPTPPFCAASARCAPPPLQACSAPRAKPASDSELRGGFPDSGHCHCSGTASLPVALPVCGTASLISARLLFSSTCHWQSASGSGSA
jgi:hypothetical protein